MIFINNGRFEVKPHTILLKHDRHGTACTGSRTGLDDRDRELTAGEKTRLLTVHGDQVRLGQRAERSVSLQCLYHAGHVTTQNKKVESTEGAAQQSVSNVGRVARTTAAGKPADAGGCLVLIRGT